MTPELPDVNALLHVDVGLGATGLPSRVQDLVAGDLVIAAPSYRGDVELPAPGQTLLLHWTGPRGIHALTVCFAGLDRVGRGQLSHWVVSPVGDVELVQRRRFVRTAVEESVALVPRDAVLTSVAGGWLIDLGEGGIRARFDAPSPLAPHTRVEIHLTLRDTVVTLVGCVLRCTPVEQTDGSRVFEAVITFEPTEHQGDLIRRTVLHQQVLARRQARA